MKESNSSYHEIEKALKPIWKQEFELKLQKSKLLKS